MPKDDKYNRFLHRAAHVAKRSAASLYTAVAFLTRVPWSTVTVAVATMVAAGATVVYTVLADRQWHAMRSQWRVMQEQLQEMRAEQRAWISLTRNSGIESMFIDRVNGEVAAKLKLDLKNTGKDPATAVVVNGEMSVVLGKPLPYGSMHAWQAEVCQHANGNFGLTMFPGALAATYDLQVNSQIAALKGHPSSVPNALVSPWVAVCIGYTDAVTGIRHYTPLAFRILARPCCAIPLRRLPMQANRLELTVWPFDNIPPT